MSGDAEILDVRYSRHEGGHRGRAAAVASLTRWGALRALGARRGWKAKILPIILCVAAAGPALVVLGVRALFTEFTDRSPIDLEEVLPYADYQSIIGLLVLLFAVVLAPDLLCPDRRDGVLALYFSTAVGRGEYLLGRFLACVLPLLLVTLAPMLLLFAGNVFFAEDSLGYLTDEWAQLPRIVGAGLLLAVYFGVLALAVSSLTARRAYAVGGYVMMLIATSALSGLLQGAFDQRRHFEALDLVTLPIALARMLFPGAEDEFPTPVGVWVVGYVVVVGVAGLVLIRRYRRERL